MAFIPNSSLAEQAQSAGKSRRDGVFIQKGNIFQANISYDASVRETWSPSSVILRMKLKIKGLKFDPDVVLYGDYKVSGGEITDEGSTFKVWGLIKNLAKKHGLLASYGVDGKLIYENETIEGPVSFLDGKEIWTLSYIAYRKDDGSPGYRTFGQAFVQFDSYTDEEFEQYIREAFYRQVEGGWEKNYDPTIAKDGEWPEELKSYARSIGSSVGTNLYKAPVSDSVFTTNDDLPF